MKNKLESLIRAVPDFPKPGVVFKDISPLMKDHWSDMVSLMSENIPWKDIDYVIGIESRGFILGSAMAIKHNKGFIPVRKKGKLPPPVHSESYELEYGNDTLEMSHNSISARVLIVDDVLATGGTLKAVMNLCERNNFIVTGMSVFINLAFLNKFKENKLPLFSVFDY
jgi:adenine phosphoribosyltransferase